MREQTPEAVYDAIHSLGVRWLGTRRGKVSFGGDQILTRWWKDIADSERTLNDEFGIKDSVAKEDAALDEIGRILKSHGHKIWSVNTKCRRLEVGENKFYRHALVYPRDEKKLIQKHLTLLKCKWRQKVKNSAVKWREQRSSNYDTSSGDETSSTLERPKKTKSSHSRRGVDSDSELQSEIDCVSSGEPSENSATHTGHPRCERHHKNELSSHTQMYQFRCRVCERCLSQSQLASHAQAYQHDVWDVLPLSAEKDRQPPLDSEQTNFSQLGYGLNTERASKLGHHEAVELLQVREQVDESVVQFCLENSVGMRRMNLQYCYKVQKFFERVASAADVDVNELELLHIMLPWDFTSELEIGECHIIPMGDEDAFREFVGLIERAWREPDGLPRKLRFLCKVFLRKE